MGGPGGHRVDFGFYFQWVRSDWKVLNGKQNNFCNSLDEK